MGVGVEGTLLVLWAALSCAPRGVVMVWAGGLAVAPSPPPCAPRATGVRRGPKRLRCRRASRVHASAGRQLDVHWWREGRAGGVTRSGGMAVALFRWRGWGKHGGGSASQGEHGELLSVGAAREERGEHSPRARRRRVAGPQCRRGGHCGQSGGWARARRAGGLAAVAEQRPRRYGLRLGGGAGEVRKKLKGCIGGGSRSGLSLAWVCASSGGAGEKGAATLLAHPPRAPPGCPFCTTSPPSSHLLLASFPCSINLAHPQPPEWHSAGDGG